MKRLALLASVLLATTVQAQDAPGQAAPDRRFTGRDLFDLAQASDPEISPDGTRVFYVRQSGDIMTDRYRGSLWLVDARTGQQTPLVASGASPRWSPDGTRIAYVAADGNAAQLFVRWVATGATARITGLPDAPGAISWSPDGRWLAYTMTVPGEGMKLGKAPPKPEGANWAPPLQIIDRVNYRNDGPGYVKPGYDHIFVVAADGGAPRQLTFGDYDDGGPLSWTRDGRAIVFSAIRGPDAERTVLNSEVMRVELASGALTALTSRNGPDASPVVSPDGSKIAWVGFDDSRRSNENLELYVGDADAKNPRSLTASLDRSIEDAQWSGDSRSLFVSYDDHGVRKVARVGLDGRVTPIATGLTGGGLDRPYTGGSFSVARGGTLAYTGGDAANPADLYIGTRRVTRLNDNLWAAKALGQVKKLPVTAKDGRPIDAWLVTPAGYQPGTKLPLILEIHGGPHSAYGPAFSTDDQLYASAGYAVLYTNPRGSTSYGEEFANLIDKNYPSDDYGDLMSSVDAAITAGVADPDNLFVTGGSGGGVLTAWIVGKTDRFKAAVTQKPVINWVSEALTMDNTVFTSTYWFRKRPWEDPMEYWNRSPLSLVGNVTTPTAVVVGSNDYRTPVSEAEQYYAALQIRGVPTALVKVPEASHGGIAARPSQAAAKAAAIVAWFDRYRGKPKWQPGQAVSAAP